MRLSFLFAATAVATVRRGPVSAKLLRHFGEVSERFKEHAWKACVGEILPWVRIPPSPPFLQSQRVRAFLKSFPKKSPTGEFSGISKQEILMAQSKFTSYKYVKLDDEVWRYKKAVF